MTPSFRTVNRQTYRRVAIAGVLFCLAFVMVSFSPRPVSDEVHALVKADRLAHTAGEGLPAKPRRTAPTGRFSRGIYTL
jgi:hypothetical protein